MTSVHMSVSNRIDQCRGCGAPFDSSRSSGNCSYCGLPVLQESVLTRSLRIETAGNVASILLPKGTPLPASMVEVFSTAADNQERVGIHLLEGESEASGQCRTLGTFALTGIRPQPRAKPEIQFSI